MENDNQGIDFSVLKKISNGDNEFYQHIIELYKDQFKSLSTDLPLEVCKMDYFAAEKILHKVSSSIKVLNIDTINTMISELRQILKESNDPAFINKKTNELIHVVDQFSKVLEEIPL